VSIGLPGKVTKRQNKKYKKYINSKIGV
jgi:hypothetical protein